MKTTNQVPQELNPIIEVDPSKDIIDEAIEDSLKRVLVEPLWTPLTQGYPVSIADDKGNELDADTLFQALWRITDDVLDAQAETVTKAVYDNTCLYIPASDPKPMANLYVTQAQTREGMKPATPVYIYTSQDVIDGAKAWIASKGSDLLFANIFNAFTPKTLGFAFLAPSDFDDMKAFVKAEVAALDAQGLLDADVVANFSQFDAIDLTGALTQSLRLRGSNFAGNDPYSFARVLPSLLMRWCEHQSQQQSPTAVAMPFDLAEAVSPETVVLINAAEHGHSSPKEVTDEWTAINNALNAPVKVVNPKKLQSMAGVSKSVNHYQQLANSAKMQQVVRYQEARFRKQRPSNLQVLSKIKRVVKGMIDVARSSNPYKVKTTSFSRANRRDPSDYNRPGTVTMTRYKPDIHIYLDNSGSISEKNYQDAVMMLIQLAKRLDVNLYFNSFSNVLSACTLLPTKGRSLTEIYNQFRKIPKVSGGTDFAQIWRYIEASPKRKEELSLIVTDMEYMPPRTFLKHPDNCYYVACSNTDWDCLTRDAKQFCEGMRHIDPHIRRKLLF